MEQQPNYGTQGAPAQAPTQAQQQQQYGGFPPAQENTYLLGNMWGVGNAMPLNPALTAHFLDYRALVFRGIVALIFSITAFALPFETVQAFVWIYAGSMCAIGTVMMITGVSYCMGLAFALGCLELLTGVLAFMYQGLTALIMLYIVAFRMIFAGTMFLAIAWTGRSQFDAPSDLPASLGLSGFIFLLAGFSLLAVHPVEGILALVWVVAAQALCDSLFSFYGACRMYQIQGAAAQEPLPIGVA